MSLRAFTILNIRHNGRLRAIRGYNFRLIVLKERGTRDYSPERLVVNNMPLIARFMKLLPPIHQYVPFNRLINFYVDLCTHGGIYSAERE